MSPLSSSSSLFAPSLGPRVASDTNEPPPYFSSAQRTTLSLRSTIGATSPLFFSVRQKPNSALWYGIFARRRRGRVIRQKFASSGNFYCQFFPHHRWCAMRPLGSSACLPPAQFFFAPMSREPNMQCSSSSPCQGAKSH